jgi:hypothetical protein
MAQADRCCFDAGAEIPDTTAEVARDDHGGGSVDAYTA